MRSRHRHRSLELVFNAKVQESIQLNSGGTDGAALGTLPILQLSTAALTSTAPLPARFIRR
jgi:hypothetical protein